MGCGTVPAAVVCGGLEYTHLGIGAEAEAEAGAEAEAEAGAEAEAEAEAGAGAEAEAQGRRRGWDGGCGGGRSFPQRLRTSAKFASFAALSFPMIKT